MDTNLKCLFTCTVNVNVYVSGVFDLFSVMCKQPHMTALNPFLNGTKKLILMVCVNEPLVRKRALNEQSLKTPQEFRLILSCTKFMKHQRNKTYPDKLLVETRHTGATVPHRCVWICPRTGGRKRTLRRNTDAQVGAGTQSTCGVSPAACLLHETRSSFRL